MVGHVRPEHLRVGAGGLVSEEMLSVAQVADRAGVTPRTIRRRLTEDGHPSFPNARKDASGVWLIPVEDLKAAGFDVPDTSHLVTDREGGRPDTNEGQGVAQVEHGWTPTEKSVETEWRVRAEVAEAQLVEVRERLADVRNDTERTITSLQGEVTALFGQVGQLETRAELLRTEALRARHATETPAIASTPEAGPAPARSEEEISAEAEFDAKVRAGEKRRARESAGGVAPRPTHAEGVAKLNKNRDSVRARDSEPRVEPMPQASYVEGDTLPSGNVVGERLPNGLTPVYRPVPKKKRWWQRGAG
jgi:hypothetical protein